MMCNGPRGIWAYLFVCAKNPVTREVEVCLQDNGYLPARSCDNDLLGDSIKGLFFKIFGFEPSLSAEWKWANLSLITIEDDANAIDIYYGTILPEKCDLASKDHIWVGLHSGDNRIKGLNKLLELSMRV